MCIRYIEELLQDNCHQTWLAKNIYINLKDKMVTIELFGFPAKMLFIGGKLTFIKVKNDIIWLLIWHHFIRYLCKKCKNYANMSYFAPPPSKKKGSAAVKPKGIIDLGSPGHWPKVKILQIEIDLFIISWGRSELILEVLQTILIDWLVLLYDSLQNFQSYDWHLKDCKIYVLKMSLAVCE